MKRLLAGRTRILVALVLAALLYNACDSTTGVGGPTAEDGDTDTNQNPYCPSETFTTKATGDAGSGKYLWLGVMDQEGLVAQGDPVFVSGSYAAVPVSIEVGSWNKLPDGEYVYRLFECNDTTEVGIVKLRSSAAEAGRAEFVGYAGVTEAPNCCSKTGYVYHTKLECPVDSAVLVAAEIETRFGKLCGEDHSFTDSAQSGAWVTIHGKPDGTLRPPFVQFGYMNYRFPLSNGTRTGKHYYVEILPRNTNKTWFEHFDLSTDPVPLEGSVEEYAILARMDKPVFEFSLNDNFTYPFDLTNYPNYWSTSNYWVPGTGSFVMYAGEIRGIESDMPGTVGNPCSFSKCRSLSYTDIWDEYLQYDATIHNIVLVYNKKWMLDIQVGASDFSICDLDPLP